MESRQPTKGFFHRMTDIVIPKSEFREQSHEVKKVLKGGGHHICQCVKKGKPLGSCGGSFTDSVSVRVAPK